MYWTNDKGFYDYNFSETDPEYNSELKRNETNIFATVWLKVQKLRFRKGSKRRYVLVLGGLGGELQFKRLKEAKHFALKTLIWMRKDALC